MTATAPMTCCILVVEIKGYRREDAGKEIHHGHLLGARREPPWHLRPLGLRRVHRGVSDRGRLQGQGRRRIQQDDRVRRSANGDTESNPHGQEPKTKTVDALKHDDAKRKNIPTAEYQSVLTQEQHSRPKQVRYPRNTDLDPQLVWRGKDEQDWSDLVVHAPPLYIQEKVHPKVLIDDLLRETKEREHEAGQQGEPQPTCSPTSTASPRAPTRPSSTSTTRTGPTA
jgi:hypothetical protein